MSANPAPYLDANRKKFVKRWTAPLIAFGEFIDGYDLIVISVAMAFMVKDFDIAPSMKGHLVAISLIGTAVGLIFFGDLADRIGRKKVFAFNLWIFIITAILAAMITNLWMLVAMRFFIGVAIGMDLSCSAAYLAEVAPKEKRGRIAGSLLNICFVAGGLFSVILALVLNAIVPAEYTSYIWRGMFAFAAVPSAFVLMMRRLLPESPRWLIQNGREEEGRAVLEALDLTDEFVLADAKPVKRNYRTLLKGDALRRMLVVIAFFVLNTTAGPIVTQLAPVIFTQVGMPKEQNLWVTFGINAIALVALILGALIIDRVNRRYLGMATAVVLAGCAFAVGWFGTTMPQVMIIAFFVWAFTTYFGPGVLCFVWSAEAYPTELRGFGSGLTQSLSRVASATTVNFLPILIANAGGTYTPISYFAIVYVLMFLVVLFNPWLGSTNRSLERVSEGSLSGK